MESLKSEISLGAILGPFRTVFGPSEWWCVCLSLLVAVLVGAPALERGGVCSSLSSWKRRPGREEALLSPLSWSCCCCSPVLASCRGSGKLQRHGGANTVGGQQDTGHGEVPDIPRKRRRVDGLSVSAERKH